MGSFSLEPETLKGRDIHLEVLSEPHREGLRLAAGDKRMWSYMPLDASGEEFDSWFDWSLAQAQKGVDLVYAVRRLSDEALVGSTRFLNIDRHNRRAEIGFTWYRPEAQGTVVNPEAKYLLFAHAFAAGAVRVELKTDKRNARSRAAIAKLGATEEGIFRRHMILWDGYIRDTVYFSVLDHEWPEVKAGLEARLAAFE